MQFNPNDKYLDRLTRKAIHATITADERLERRSYPPSWFDPDPMGDLPLNFECTSYAYQGSEMPSREPWMWDGNKIMGRSW
jgi:hypothetical protein